MVFHDLSINELRIGMSAEIERLITIEDVKKFAELSGDTNPIHLDEIYAAKSKFGNRIAHGLMSVSFFSALFGTQLPGNGCLYVAQSVNFKKPVFVGQTVIAKVIINSFDKERNRVYFDTICTVNDVIVIDGTAEIYMPSNK